MGPNAPVGFIGNHCGLGARLRSTATYRSRESVDGCVGGRLRGNGSNRQVAGRVR
jgi:hypothetical protein